MSAPEFHRPFKVARAGAKPHAFEIAADGGERERLARRFDLLALDALAARGKVRATREGAVVEGVVTASLAQACVATLAPVAAEIEAAFRLAFAHDAAPEAREIDVDPLSEDPPDPLIGGVVDLGEIAAEQLALALDPYPRAPDAALSEDAEAGELGAGPRRPFADLAQMMAAKTED